MTATVSSRIMQTIKFDERKKLEAGNGMSRGGFEASPNKEEREDNR